MELRLLRNKDDLAMTLNDMLLSHVDTGLSALSAVEEFVLLLEEVVLDVLFLLQDVLVNLQYLANVHADSLGHDELASQAVALVEFSPEPSQLSHDLQELALSLRILELDSVFLGYLLGVELLQGLIFIKDLCQLDLVLLENSATDLLVGSLERRT